MLPTSLPNAARLDDDATAVIRELSKLLAQPSGDLPSVRCLSRSTLFSLLRRIRTDLQARGSKHRLAHSHVLARLMQMGLVTPVPLHASETGKPTVPLYLIEVGASAIKELDPIELLVAAEPQGIVCYFSALNVHQLTTQPCAHHHVARLSRVAAGRKVAARSPAARRTDRAPGRSYNPLGTAMFSYRGLTYYRTFRDPGLLVSYQQRFLDPHTRFRVTTLEQTLIDTLHRPLSCGGPAVVFEAWETALERLEDGRMAAILQQIGRQEVVRKVGWMLEACGYTAGAELAGVLIEAREGVDPTASQGLPPLLPGFENPRTDHRWQLQVP